VELYKCESDVGKKRVLLDSREEKENSYMGVKKRLKNSKIGFYTVEPRLHNNAFKGTPPLEDKISKSQNYSGFCNVKIPLVNSLCFNSDSPF